jgi:hypothetical protein
LTCGGEEKVVATTALASTRADGVTRAAAAMSSCWGRAVDSVRGGGASALCPSSKLVKVQKHLIHV